MHPRSPASQPRSDSTPLRRSLVCALALTVPLCGAGCGGPVKPPPRARQSDALVVRDVPSILRDTLAAQATLSGTTPTLISGYGLVVGLDGTGSAELPGAVRAVMEREMTIMGVGRETGAFAGITPTELLGDRNTAVVIVSAAIAPGAPVGTLFDVSIDALPGTSTSSLQGGRLYTTRLFRGVIRPAAPATEPLAEANGQIFINPYADPAEPGALPQTRGRVLNGGVVSQPLRITLSLDAPSHTRVRAMVDAINARFPPARGQPKTAVGLNEELVEINIPPEYRGEPTEFFSVLARVRVDQSFPDEAAKRYVQALQDQPELAESLARCLEGIGQTAMQHVRTLYDYPEVRPRLAAVTVGARLGDMTVQPALEDLAENSPIGTRLQAIRLMSRLGTNPRIDLYLREKLDAPEVEVRIAAYESLDLRQDPIINRKRVGEAFILDVVPSAQPMVYVTLQRTPKIVVFGGDVPIRRPVFASVWDDRLMLSSASEESPLRVFHRDYRTTRTTTDDVKPTLPELIEFLAHVTTPENPQPGLGLPYSEVVGALAGFVRAGAVSALFVPENDKLNLELLRLRQTEQGQERPEFEGDMRDDSETDEFAPSVPKDGRPEGVPAVPADPDAEESAAEPGSEPAEAPAEGSADPAKPPKRQYVVPLTPPTPPADQSKSKGKGKKGG